MSLRFGSWRWSVAKGKQNTNYTKHSGFCVPFCVPYITVNVCLYSSSLSEYCLTLYYNASESLCTFLTFILPAMTEADSDLIMRELTFFCYRGRDRCKYYCIFSPLDHQPLRQFLFSAINLVGVGLLGASSPTLGLLLTYFCFPHQRLLGKLSSH